MSHMGGGHMSSQMSPTGPTYPGKNGFETFGFFHITIPHLYGRLVNNISEG